MIIGIYNIFWPKPLFFLLWTISLKEKICSRLRFAILNSILLRGRGSSLDEVLKFTSEKFLGNKTSSQGFNPENFDGWFQHKTKQYVEGERCRENWYLCVRRGGFQLNINKIPIKQTFLTLALRSNREGQVTNWCFMKQSDKIFSYSYRLNI